MALSDISVFILFFALDICYVCAGGHGLAHRFSVADTGGEEVGEDFSWLELGTQHLEPGMVHLTALLT